MFDIVLDVYQEVLLILPMIVGIYISYTILKVTDFSVEASFVMSACVLAKVLHSGGNIYIGIALSLSAAVMIGLFVNMVHRILAIPTLITGVLVVFMFQSIEFHIMGQPNMQIKKSITDENLFIAYSLINVAVISVLYVVLNSQLGLKLRAIGVDKSLSKKLGVNVSVLYCSAIVTSNFLAGVSGMLHAYYGGFADLYMGVGVALVGVASLMIGTLLINVRSTEPFSFRKDICAILLGVTSYSLIITTLIYMGCDAIYLKLILGVIVFIAIYTSRLNANGVIYAEAC